MMIGTSTCCSGSSGIAHYHELVDVCVQLLVPTAYHVDDLVVSRRENISASIMPRLGLLALRAER